MLTHNISAELILTSDSPSYRKALSVVAASEASQSNKELSAEELLQTILSEVLEDLLLERLNATVIKRPYLYSRDEVQRMLAECVLTTSEAAEKLGITSQSLNGMVYRGKLTPIHSSKGGHLFYAGDIEQKLLRETL